MIWLGASGVVLAGGLVAWLALVAYARRSDNWGATAEEIAAELPGDDWLGGGPAARTRMTRAVWIEAPAEVVWPWLAQMGRGAGWYSYDRLDNGGRLSASHIVSWIPEPRLGDASAIGYLRHQVASREIGWWLRGIDLFGARFRGVMFFRVIAAGGRCRLLTRFQADVKGLTARPACWLFRCIDGFMARRQLAGFRERAETYGARESDPARPESGARDQYQLYQTIFATGGEAGVRGKEQAATFHRHAMEDGVLVPDASAPADSGETARAAANG